MSTTTLRSGFDTWVNSAKKSTNYSTARAMNLKTGAEMGFFYMGNPVPRGATVTNATLTFYAKGASTGAGRTVTVARVGSWKEGKVNWQNKPDTVGTSASSVAFGALKERAPITVNVTALLQAIAGGAPNNGFRLVSNAASRLSVYGFASSDKPVLSVTWSDAPTKPVNLRPSEAVTSLALPHVTFSSADYGGKGVANVRVQVYNSTLSTMLLDTGDIAQTSQTVDLSDFSGSWVGMAEGESVKWRAMVRDGDGLSSAWSDFVSMTRKAKGVVAITNMGAEKAYETTPPITWTFSKVQVAFQVAIWATDTPHRILYLSSTSTTTESEFTIPESAGLKDDTRYTVEVRCWDGEVREAAPGDDTFAGARADFYLDVDANTAPPATLVASPVDLSPWLDLTWTRSVMPDEFVILRDGVQVGRVDAPDVFVSGSTYRWRFRGARPNREHVYTVRAIANKRQSADSPARAFTTSPSGLWIVDLDESIDVTLWGNDNGAWNMVDDAEVFAPLGSTQVVRVVTGLRGLEGTLTGLLMDGFGKTFEQMERDLYRIKSNPTNRIRIVAGDENFEAIVGNVKIAPKPETREGRIVKSVSFDFWQVGALPFSL